jgi:hypothetical protein
MVAPKMSDMPRRDLPMSIDEDALSTVAIALFAKDMATAADDHRMVSGHDTPAFVLSRGVEVKGKAYKMTLTLQFEPST